MILRYLKSIFLPFLFALLSLVCQFELTAQSGTEFWLAPPDITDLHNAPGGEPLYLLVSSTGQPSTVTIEQPANPGFVPIVVNVAANKSQRVNLTAFKSQLETRPTNTVVNTGLHITSTTTITCYYECANTNNTDIWALKGPNAEGTEFYIPLHKHAPFFNEASFASPHQAFASFDICATQNNTVVTIYSPTPVDGHPALQQFTVNLNRGQAYSCGFTGTNWSLPSTHPSGAIVLANYPITVSLKDDSDHNPSGGCYDILGDQIVPVDVVGEDYIAVKGSLNTTGDESVVLMATQNNTQVFVDGGATPIATLFAGEYFRIDMDSLSTSINNALYVHCTKPTYAMHITGFGCEMGMAQLPPLNCAGSQQLNFVRDDAQTFYITVLCRTTAINAFTVTGPGTATIPGSAFVPVPGTGGVWRAAKITYSTTDVPVDSTFKVSNSVDVFALGVVNGGATSGCKYGYFSEFVAPIIANAGINQTICANTTATLAGMVSGGTITGEWTSTGTGSFTPSNTTLNAVYTPSAADAAVGSVTLTLTSTGACIPVSDAMLLTITPAPTASAGSDLTRCGNNANIALSGVVTVATGGVWTGGAGTFIPGNNVLDPVYVPTSGEIASGSLTLTLTTTGNGICNPVSDNITITFTLSPVVNAGSDQTVCGNNPAATLSGSVTVASGGVWTGGGGSFVPSASSLNPVYTASAGEIASGSVTLTLTSTGNSNCTAVSDQMTLFFSAPPVITAGPDQIKCANNAVTTLAGNVTGATGGQWTGGLGVFSPNNTIANATYTPTAGEVSSGLVVLTFTSTGNATCNAVSDQVSISFTAAPTANAGPNQTVCANNPVVTLSGSFTVAAGASWSGGTGVFSPSNTSMTAAYTPSAAEISLGSVTLTLTTTGNGSCNEVTDQILITISPAPTVNAGPNQTRCSNNPDATLAGSITTATGGTWSGGAGTFNPSASALNAVYSPTVDEINVGSVTLTLTSTGNGSCNAVSDQIAIFYSSSPTVNAGNDQVLCANNAVATLGGNVSIAGGGQWTGGLGIFLPNNNTLNATYSPTASEISSGLIQLTLTTTSNGSCNAVSDQMTIAFTAAPTVNAGSDISVCGNNALVSLNGSFTTATGANWSGGNGVFLPNSTSINASYTPTPSEISSGGVTLTLTSTGNGTCATVSDQVFVAITPSPVVNAGSDQTRCANNPSVSLSGSITVASGGNWTGGLGTFNPSASSLNAVYTPSVQEITNGSVTLTLTSTGNGNCNAVSDQVTIFFSSEPTVNAGSDQSLCANNASVNLSGSVTTAGGGQWSGGLGVFSPNNNSLNATYTPSAGEIANGSLALTLTTTSNGGCNAVSDAIILFFTPAPTSNASTDVSVCENNATVNLNGSFTIASGVVWTGGSGNYSPGNTSATASYIPSQQEIDAGTSVLTMTTTGNGNCNAVSDQITITILPEPIVNAGTNISACTNNAAFSLNGQVFNATGGIWSGGAGSFSPNPSVLNATYTPAQSEITSGSVTLTLTSTGNGNCNPVSDEVTISFAPSPISLAGNDQILCGNNAVANLNGAVGFSTGGQWTGGLGLFAPASNSPIATYTPTAGEIAAGFVNLILTTTGNGSCLAVSDTIQLVYTPTPQVDAGASLTTCANNPIITLNGNFSNATGAIWSGGLGTFVPGNTAMNATYLPSASEISNGGLSLVLTSTGIGNCQPVSDMLDIEITPAPAVNAGVDQLTCNSNLNVGLSGSVSGTTNTGVWSTTGTGAFIPNNTTLNATYQCSNDDVLSGTIVLTLTSTFNGSCLAVSDQMQITILPPGGANAGNDQIVCGNNAAISLNGIVSGGASSGIWGSTGTGTFTPNNTSLNTIYSPSAFDVLNGSVILHLTANSCNYASDSLEVLITPAPEVNSGSDITICSSEINVPLNGSVSGASTTGIWISSGSGTFSPSNATLNAGYTPSAADISNQTIYLILTSTANGQCLPVSDTLTLNIFPSGSANAGADQILCANNADVIISGSLGGGATTSIWSTSGSGTFDNALNSLQTVYHPSSADLILGNVELTLTATNSCNAASDDVSIQFTAAPTVDAGEASTVCANNAVISLDGSFTISTGAIWSGGAGVFSPSNSTMNASYTPSLEEILNGSVTLQLTTDGNGLCLPATDMITVTIDPSPIVNAGADQITCITDLTVALNGSVQGVTTSGTWTSSGTGIFSPSNTALNAIYTLSSQDSLNGGVVLTLSSTNNNSCLPVSDNMSIDIVPAGTANAGVDVVVCANNAEIVLNGTVGGGASSGTWITTGTGTFFPTNTSLNATYIPSAFDKTNGSVYVVLTANTCTTTSDSLFIQITPAPLANAGLDQTICTTQNSLDLLGIISEGATSGIWNTNGTGSFSPSASSLNATYTPSSNDISIQELEFILTSSDNGNCLPESDTLSVHIYPTGTASAGADQILCSNNANSQLNGSLGGGATESIWSTTGSGFFIPNAMALDATYVPSAGDVLSGGVILGLTATNSCNAAIDFLSVSYSPAPTANAGPSQAFCGSNPAFVLSGSVTDAAGGIWTGGNGQFTPSNTLLNPTYIPTQEEKNLGVVVLTLSTSGNGNCNSVSDTVSLYMTNGIVTHAGTDQQVCITAPYTQLQGEISNGSSTGIWTTLGSGTFSPGQNVLNALYTYSAADLVAGSVSLILTSTGNGGCSATADTMQVTFGESAFAFAGNDQFICSSADEIPLHGFVTGGASQGIWSTTGNGDFIPSNTMLDTDYEITSSDIAAGQVTFILTTTDNGSCLPGVDTLVYTLSAPSVVNSGGDQIICAGEPVATINGNISGSSSTGVWTTLGSGVFLSNASSLQNAYQASASDIQSGFVTLILSSTINGACSADADTLLISIEQMPEVSAGSDQHFCGTVESVSLTGTVDGSATGVVWSTLGFGNFSPDANSLTTQYVVHPSDVMVGEVTLIITSVGQEVCNAVSDTMSVTIASVSAANAGNDISICSDDLQVQLGGSVSGASSTGLWTTTGTGVFIPDATNLNATYYPGLSDSIAGGVTLILTSTNTDICAPDSDSVLVTISNPAFANAGADQTLCADGAVVNLNGSITGGSSTGTWNTTGTGSFSPNAATLNASYTPSIQDLLDGAVSITLSATGIGSCESAIDIVDVIFVQPTVVSVGQDRIICGEQTEVMLGGNVSGSTTTGVWTTNGSGNFLSGNDVLNTVYELSTADIINGEVELILTSTNNTLCGIASDTLLIIVEELPVAAFSAIAGDNLDIQFTDESIGASNWFWSFGIGGSSTDQNPAVIYPEIGFYEVTLIIQNNAGCADTTSALVQALEPIGTPVAIPSGFSPNGDQSNDVLHVLGGPFRDVYFRIYNEWGNLVYSTTDPLSGWDGTYKGEPQPGGVYVYTATGTTVKGRYVRLSGNVTLIR
jgi:gliding motility-associated-like protein